MTDFKFERTGGIGLLHFSGEVTVEDSENLRKGFLVSFESSDHVVLNFTNVTKLDAGCFKIFCSAYRIFTRCNKQLSIIGLGPKVFRATDAQVLPECGSHCIPEYHDGCLWSGIKNGRGE
jgi:anti-anti-sigma regulatory factor